MHDHDDPRRCSVCRKSLDALESYGELLNFTTGRKSTTVTIESTVQQYLDAFDWASAVQPAVRA